MKSSGAAEAEPAENGGGRRPRCAGPTPRGSDDLVAPRRGEVLGPVAGEREEEDVDRGREEGGGPVATAEDVGDPVAAAVEEVVAQRAEHVVLAGVAEHAVVALAAAHQVVAVAAQHQVVALAAVHLVVAVAAVEQVVAVPASEVVVAGLA